MISTWPERKAELERDIEAAMEQGDIVAFTRAWRKMIVYSGTHPDKIPITQAMCDRLLREAQENGDHLDPDKVVLRRIPVVVE